MASATHLYNTKTKGNLANCLRLFFPLVRILLDGSQIEDFPKYYKKPGNFTYVMSLQ